MKGATIKGKSQFKKSVAVKNPASIIKTDKRILLGEREVVLQKIYAACLTQLDYQVDIASTGKQILELYYDSHYVLIILSDDFPDSTSTTIAQTIRANEQVMDQTAVPIILLTEAPYAQIKKDRERLNVNDFLIKPVRLQELQALVRHWLEFIGGKS